MIKLSALCMLISNNHKLTISTLSMLNPIISNFENSVYPDQLASEKPADLDLHCFFLLVDVS